MCLCPRCSLLRRSLVDSASLTLDLVIGTNERGSNTNVKSQMSRRRCVHNLRIDRNTANGQRLPHASVTAAITMTQASSLRYIRINTDDRSFTGCDAAFLASSRQNLDPQQDTSCT